MSAQTIGLISGSLVIISIIPYAIRIYQGKIRPVAISWSIWSLIGLAILLTYRSSGAEANIWPAVFGFTNPLLVTALAIHQQKQWKKPEPHEWICLFVGVASLVVWFFVQQSRELSQYALYLAIVADSCAAIPTLIFFSRDPLGDRPFCWFIYGIGYFIALFAITEPTWANYALPTYMMLGSMVATLFLVIPRVRRGVPLKEWV